MHTGRLTKAHWRKSALWFAMSRPLAAVVARDDHVAPVFERECYTYAINGKVPAPPHVKARTHMRPSSRETFLPSQRPLVRLLLLLCIRRDPLLLASNVRGGEKLFHRLSCAMAAQPTDHND